MQQAELSEEPYHLRAVSVSLSIPHSYPPALISIAHIYMITPSCHTHLDASHPDEQGSGEAWENHACPKVVQRAFWLRHHAGLVLSLAGWVLGRGRP